MNNNSKVLAQVILYMDVHFFTLSHIMRNKKRCKKIPPHHNF